MRTSSLDKIGIAGRELFVQFLTRIYFEIHGCFIAQFSTLKILQAPNFLQFRTHFKPKLLSLFVVPAHTFDNVKGKFPIGFYIWNSKVVKEFVSIKSEVYDDYGDKIFDKTFSVESGKSINDWLISTRIFSSNKNIGFISAKGNDFQNTNFVFIINDKSQLPHPRGSWVTDSNLIEVCIYFSVRHSIEPTWINDRDQFLYPNDGWQKDDEFQNDCLAFTLFSNNIQSKFGTNYWIPFTEKEVNARDKFESNFMSQFIAGKLKPSTTTDLFGAQQHRSTPLVFSAQAQAVLNAGRALWQYYHQQPHHNVNASLYDIREYFQGRNEAGKMNNKSTDEIYMGHINTLREQLKQLAAKIEPKVYEYGFLKR